MRLTIALTALLLVVMLGHRGGATGQTLLLPAQELFTIQDVPVSPSGTTHPSGGSTPTPYTETSSIQIAPRRTESSVEARICSYQWPCAEALAVAFCESRYDPAARNSSGAKGLWQFMPVHDWRLGPGETFYDPVVATRIAYEVWSEQGWTPWESCR